MLKSELIKILESIDGDFPVLVDGYEYGQHDLGEVNLTTAELGDPLKNDPVMGGPHKVLDPDRPGIGIQVPVIHLTWKFPKN